VGGYFLPRSARQLGGTANPGCHLLFHKLSGMD
jgi:hypothetical protein